MAKRLELLKEVMPGVTRVAILVNPANASFAPRFKQLEIAARSLNLSLNPFEVRTRSDFDRVFAEMAKVRVHAMVIQDDTIFGQGNAGTIAELAARQRILAVGGDGFADAGGMIDYA